MKCFDDRKFASVVGAAFLALLLVVVFRHEMWRDEMQIWMIARNSHSILDLFHNIHFEPHPALWYLIAFLFSHISTNPITLQLVHTAIASAAAYIFLRFAPLPRLWRALFVFGFFPFYEYGVISRCYSLGLLLTFAFCALFPVREKRILGLSALLFLLANCSAYGMFFALTLGLTLLVARIHDWREGYAWSTAAWKSGVAAAIVLAGIAISTMKIMPPADSPRFAQTCLEFDWHYLLAIFSFISMVYLYNFGALSWLYGPWQSLVLFIAAMMSFVGKPVAMFAWVCGTVMMLSASYIKALGFTWHIGHLFILFIVCQWLAAYYEPSETRWGWVRKYRPSIYRMTSIYITALLVFQIFPCAYAAYLDILYPFSNAKAVAQYIASHSLDDRAVAGEMDYCASTVAGYLDKPVYYLCSNNFGTYIVWDRNRSDAPLSPNELYGSLQALKTKTSRNILLVMSYPLPEEYVLLLDASPIECFTGNIGGFTQSLPPAGEDYWLYDIEH